MECPGCRMISVVIETRDEEAALAATLAGLVPAAAEGFVREVIVAGGGGHGGVVMLADAFGCALEAGGRERAVAAARGDWVLLLRPGTRLDADWFREAAVFIEQVRRAGAGASQAALLRRAAAGFGWRSRVGVLAGLLARGPGPWDAVLAQKKALAAGARLRFATLRARTYVEAGGAA